VSDESKLPITRKDGSSQRLSQTRSSLIARARRDATTPPTSSNLPRTHAGEFLSVPMETEHEEDRFYYEDGTSVWPDGRARDEVQRGADAGNVNDQNMLARFLCHCKDPEDRAESVRVFLQAAEHGYAPAQYNVAWMYDGGFGLRGLGPKQDYAEAVRWYKKAAEQGLAHAQFNLGTMYDKGDGVAQDHAEAVKWYRVAAVQGFWKAQYNLALKYDKGQGVAQDHTEAAKLFRQAADRGFYKAQFNLGVKYITGRGVAQDYVQALMWITLAAAQVANSFRWDENDSRARDSCEKKCINLRDKIADKINPTQIAEAQRLAREWKPTVPDE
jgi:TPR repeat protein